MFLQVSSSMSSNNIQVNLTKAGLGQISRLIIAIILCILLSFLLFIVYAKILPNLQTMVQGQEMGENKLLEHSLQWDTIDDLYLWFSVINLYDACFIKTLFGSSSSYINISMCVDKDSFPNFKLK